MKGVWLNLFILTVGMGLGYTRISINSPQMEGIPLKRIQSTLPIYLHRPLYQLYYSFMVLVAILDIVLDSPTPSQHFVSVM